MDVNIHVFRKLARCNWLWECLVVQTCGAEVIGSGPPFLPTSAPCCCNGEGTANAERLGCRLDLEAGRGCRLILGCRPDREVVEGRSGQMPAAITVLGGVFGSMGAQPG